MFSLDIESSAVVYLISVIISACVSWIVAVITSRNQTKRLLLTFKHQDDQAKQEALSAVLSAASRFLQTENGRDKAALQSAIANLIPQSTEEERLILTELNRATRDNNFLAFDELLLNLENAYHAPNNNSRKKKHGK